MLFYRFANHSDRVAKGPGPSWHHFRNILTFPPSRFQGLSVLNPHRNCPPCAVLCCKVARQQWQTNIRGACAPDHACAPLNNSASRSWSWHGPAGFWVSAAYHHLCIFFAAIFQISISQMFWDIDGRLKLSCNETKFRYGVVRNEIDVGWGSFYTLFLAQKSIKNIKHLNAYQNLSLYNCKSQKRFTILLEN